jgi:hypothetical protein
MIRIVSIYTNRIRIRNDLFLSSQSLSLPSEVPAYEEDEDEAAAHEEPDYRPPGQLLGHLPPENIQIILEEKTTCRSSEEVNKGVWGKFLTPFCP